MDSRFRVEVVSKTDKPQQIIYAALKQDYSEDFVFDSIKNFPSESKCGEIAVRRLLKGNKGHFGPLEHPQIILNFGFFPHSTFQQLRTHRNVSFDCMSFRYTSDHILGVAEGSRDIEDVFYLRPVGEYTDRSGKKYEYTAEMRDRDLEWCHRGAELYARRISQGLSEEHARGLIPFDVRQHWVMSGNARSIMHLLDIRGKFDVQLETRWMTELMFTHFQAWMPEVCDWYEKNRWRKGALAP